MMMDARQTDPSKNGLQADTSNGVRDAASSSFSPTPDLRLAYARIIADWCNVNRTVALNAADAILALKATPLIGLSQGEGERLADLIRGRDGVDFDGEVRLTSAEGQEIIAVLSDLSLPGVADLSARVRRLVIAARVVAYSDGQTNMTELDQAAEAFAADIAWEDGSCPIPGRPAAGDMLILSHARLRTGLEQIAAGHGCPMALAEDTLKHCADAPRPADGWQTIDKLELDDRRVMVGHWFGPMQNGEWHWSEELIYAGVGYRVDGQTHFHELPAPPSTPEQGK